MIYDILQEQWFCRTNNYIPMNSLWRKNIKVSPAGDFVPGKKIQYDSYIL